MEFLPNDVRKTLGKEVVFGKGENTICSKYDPLYHLRSDNRDSKVVLDLLKKENQHAETTTKHLNYFSEKMYNKILSHIKEDGRSVPHMFKKWWFWTTTERGRSYEIHWRKLVSPKNSKPEQILDVIN